jgi:hypothetical protein
MVLALWLLGCGTSVDASPPRGAAVAARSTASLVPLADCDSVEQAIRNGALVSMNQALDEKLAQAIASLGACHAGADAGVTAMDGSLSADAVELKL